MTSFLEYALEAVAPLYNLALVLVVLVMFYFLFKKPNDRVYLKPWKFLLISLCVFVIEEILTVLTNFKFISYPLFINGILEIFIVSSFIYMLLLQKRYLKHKSK